MSLSVEANCLMPPHETPAATPARLLLGSFLLSARRILARSPARFVTASWSVLANFSAHRQVCSLLKLAPLAGHVGTNPRFAMKYLALGYLARGLTVRERAACLVHHYRRLHELSTEQFLRQTLKANAILHTVPEGSNRFTLTIGPPANTDLEGEISLNLLVDGEVVFVLSFAIVPGWVVKSQAAEAVLITRLQGYRGAYSQIRLATRCLHNVAPPAILLAALQGVAGALGIGQLAAVSAVRQTSYSEHSAESFKSAYDAFFAELGMARNSAGFYLSPIPIEDKPLALIKKGHRLRTKEKRAFKQRIQTACAGFLE